MPRITHGLQSLAFTALLLQLDACKLPGPAGADAEGVVRLGGPGADLSLNGRTFNVRTADGKPLADLSLLIGGKVFRTSGGKLYLPPSALEDARRAGGLVVVAPGYVPAKLALGADGTLILAPMGQPRFYPETTPRGGQFKTPDGAIAITLPGGFLQTAFATVAVATYAPPTGAGVASTLSADRAGMPAGSAAACDRPWPCGPVTSSLGVALTVDGPIVPGGKLSLNYDLDALLRGWNGQAPAPWESDPGAWTPEQRDAATAAANILLTFQHLQDFPADRERLSSQYGLALDGHHLTLTVTLGSQPAVDGYTLIQVNGSELLGTRLEVTVVSTSAGSLPPYGALSGADAVAREQANFNQFLLPHGNGVVSGSGSSLVAAGAGNLVASGAGNLVASGAGNLVASGAGNLVASGAGNLVSSGAGNLVSSGAGNLVSSGAGNLVSSGAGNLVSAGAGNLDGNTIATGGGNLLAAGGGNLAGLGGAGNLIASADGAMFFTNGSRLAAARNSSFTSAIDMGAALVAAHPLQLGDDATAEPAGIYDEGGNLVSAGAGNLVSAGAGNLNAAGAANLNADGAANLMPAGVSLVDHLGASLTGSLRVPFAPDAAKYRTLSYTDYLWPGAQVAVIRQPDVAYSAVVTTNATGNFTVPALGSTPAVVFVQAQAGGYKLYSLAAAPAGVALPVVGIDAATTLLSGWVLEQLRRRTAVLSEVDPVGFTADVLVLRGLMTQAVAQNAVKAPDLRSLAAQAEIFFQAHGFRPHALTPWATVTTFAGNPTTPGWLDGTGTAARFNWPVGLTIGPAGSLYELDYGTTTTFQPLRRIDALGNTSTLSGAGAFTQNPATPLDDAAGWHLATAPDGSLYYTSTSPVIAAISRISPTGAYSVFAGAVSGMVIPTFNDGPASSALFEAPSGIARDGSGNLYVADAFNNRIRKVAPNGSVTTLAGSGTPWLGPDTPGYLDGPAATARFNNPSDVVFDLAGNLLVADANNHCIRKIDLATLTVSTLAGQGGTPGLVNLPGAGARFRSPRSLALGPDGTLYVLDTNNNRVRTIAPDGTVRTLAGLASGFGDGTGAYASFSTPLGIAVDATGTVYVADFNNNCIRKIQRSP